MNLVCPGAIFTRYRRWLIPLFLESRSLGLADNQKGLTLLGVQLPRDPVAC